MNGKSLVGSVLALSLVLAGTGYAYWTDTLSINTKATTGEFGVKFADLGLYAQYNNETLKGGWSIVDGVKHGANDGFVADDFFMRGTTDYDKIAKDGSIEQYHKEAAGFNKVEFDAELANAETLKKGPAVYVGSKGSDTINVTIEKMYPGYAQAFRTDIVNVGDIAAKLGNIKFDVKGGTDVGNLENMIGLAILVEGEQYNPTVHPNGWNIFKLAANFKDDKVFTVGGVQFVRLSALRDADFAEVLKDKEAMLCAPATDNRMDLFLGVAMDPDAEGVYTTGTSAKMTDKDDALSQNKDINVEIKLLWDQFNVGKDAGNPNILKKQNH
ncbi:hypothetical protein HMPREF0389_00797 [Filifactor alocis ATCC 35896]|uniref:Uncharacterized protein n=2 Tax=Filifactor TaxID=44259 RepID=D6GQ22_FILAD|nr:hypothetical protein HMPREF0389_00797 [Filifactor alocis ATCC 35896]